jgi:hypothetical protein
MKKVLKAFGLAVLAATVALPALADTTPAPADAKDQKDLKKVIEDQGINYVETAQKGITLSGYVDTSYTEQFAGKGEYGNSQHAALRQFDTQNNNFNVNAVKIALEKALPDKNDWAAGFRIDTIYGSDAKYLGDSAFGATTGSSGLALEQAMVKFRIPVGNGLDIYAGKFVTFLGYEVIESPANLNFSRGLLFTNAIPLTNTGVYADYKFNDMFEAKLAIVDGWNNSQSPTVNTAPQSTGDGGYYYEYNYNNGNDTGSFGKAIMGQLNINAPGKNANITQSFIYSPDGEPGSTTSQDNGPYVVYDIWGNWNPTFVKDSALLLGFNVDLGYNGDSGYPAGHETYTEYGQPIQYDDGGYAGEPDSNTWWGAALYAQYKFNKVFSLAGRLEYLHEDAAIFQKFPGSGNTDDYEGTLTASFSIWDNLLTRIEYRHDLLDLGTPGGTNQDEISLNAVYSF